ncbi:uncharacterized protein LOC110694853 [Chenopodium quinoa]|uniref:uncharacterized protein LOC110694853 n=1 Tax=Chenopodium quinoa TaxID=63459 RepID=UPI000B7841C7|nr:uncharacterized protein LOC110694853 [Chenopodium quinoa]
MNSLVLRAVIIKNMENVYWLTLISEIQASSVRLSPFRFKSFSHQDLSTKRKLSKCNCGLPLAQRTSLTHENPGRRFKACEFNNFETCEKGCDYFEWVVDEDILEWQKDVTNVLLSEKQRLATYMNVLQAKVACMENERRRLIDEHET